MFKVRVIPCLDVKDGRVVKGVNFVNLKDVGDPAENAQVYSDAGADELVFLDITASLEGRQTMLDAVKRTVQRISIPLTVGGGVSSLALCSDAQPITSIPMNIVTNTKHNLRIILLS